MNAKRTTLIVASLAVAVAALWCGQPASAGVKVRFHVGGSYGTYRQWRTVTGYRTVRRPVTKTVYRTEKRTVTTYETRRERVEESYRDRLGFYRTRKVWATVRVPVTKVEYVEVPYEETTYVYVQEPYTERVLVGTTTPSYYSSSWVTVPYFSFSVGNYGHHRHHSGCRCRTGRRPSYSRRNTHRRTVVHHRSNRGGRRTASRSSGSRRSSSTRRSGSRRSSGRGGGGRGGSGRSGRR